MVYRKHRTRASTSFCFSRDKEIESSLSILITETCRPDSGGRLSNNFISSEIKCSFLNQPLCLWQIVETCCRLNDEMESCPENEELFQQSRVIIGYV